MAVQVNQAIRYQIVLKDNGGHHNDGELGKISEVMEILTFKLPPSLVAAINRGTTYVRIQEGAFQVKTLRVRLLTDRNSLLSGVTDVILEFDRMIIGGEQLDIYPASAPNQDSEAVASAIANQLTAHMKFCLDAMKTKVDEMLVELV